MNNIWSFGLICLSFASWVRGSSLKYANASEIESANVNGLGESKPLLVGLTLITHATSKGAVCMDGSVPAYHLHRGFGSGANSWLVNLEGGGWCNDLRTCIYRKKSRRGSSYYMEKEIPFTGIMSNRREENPDFYNWNRVKVRYCDGGSFTGDAYDRKVGIFFRGHRIYQIAMEDLMSKGMRYANQALLAGCSAGGLAAIQHCDEFKSLFSRRTKVKCLADAGLFLDAVDVAGGRSLRSFFNGVVTTQGSAKTLPKTCTSRMDATSCFFPQNILPNIRTPTFILNTAYDVWQLQQSLAPPHADRQGHWEACKLNHSNCNAHQVTFLQGFRNEMLNTLKRFSLSRKNGLFINSCFAHCQMERQDTWHSNNAPQIGREGIAKVVGKWYFGRSKGVKLIDCPYPCDKTCHHQVKRKRNHKKTAANSSPLRRGLTS